MKLVLPGNHLSDFSRVKKRSDLILKLKLSIFAEYNKIAGQSKTE